MIAAQSGLFGPHFALNLLGLGAMGALIGVLHAWLASLVAAPAPAIVAGLLMLILLLVLLRTQPPLLRYLLYLGQEPTIPALVATALAAALIGGWGLTAAAAQIVPPLVMLAGTAAMLLLFLAVALLRTLHFATKPRQTAEIAMQIDVIAIALVGSLTLPLAPIVLVVRLWLLARRARAMGYSAP